MASPVEPVLPDDVSSGAGLEYDRGRNLNVSQTALLHSIQRQTHSWLGIMRSETSANLNLNLLQSYNMFT